MLPVFEVKKEISVQMLRVYVSEKCGRLLRAARKVSQIVQSEGVSAVVCKIRARINSRSRPVDSFDQQFQLDTAGEISLFQLDISSPNEVVGIRYQPSPVEACQELFASLPIRHQDFTLIDLGAGKGRVLLVASGFAFKRVIGVEFARELVETARRNIERFGCRAEVVHADAAEYKFPVDNLVVYLYHPFGSEVLRSVLGSLREISAQHDVYLIYLNAKNSSCVEEFAHEIQALRGAKVYRFERPEIGLAATAGVGSVQTVRPALLPTAEDKTSQELGHPLTGPKLE
jgi:predicted RNA methylase